MVYLISRTSPVVARQWSRSISILQQPKVGNPQDIASTTTNEDNIKDVQKLVSNHTLEVAEFKALGNPQTLLSINSPASVPLYVRRGSLVSIYGLNETSSISAVRSSLEFLHPIKRLIYGGYGSAYQKLVSTSPFSVLVSSTSRKFSIFQPNTTQSFAQLVLDGSSDWAILNKNALQAYTGNSLLVTLHQIPRTISRSLHKRLNLKGTQYTGLFKWSHAGYTLLSGRGQVGLVGDGSVYHISLADQEELLVNKKNILGITVNGPLDLGNCVYKYSFPITQVVEEVPVESIGIVHKLPISTYAKIKRYFSIIAGYFGKIGNFFRLSKNKTFNFLVGNQEFVKILGPRSILLQSSSGNGYISKSKTSISSGSQSVASPAPTSADYLNYVTVNNGKVEFESTPDFQVTVKEIEGKKTK